MPRYFVNSVWKKSFRSTMARMHEATRRRPCKRALSAPACPNGTRSERAPYAEDHVGQQEGAVFRGALPLEVQVRLAAGGLHEPPSSLTTPRTHCATRDAV